MYHHLSNTEINFIIELYQSGKSSLQIAEIIQRSRSTVLYHLHKSNVKVRACQERKYSLNDYYFDDLSSEGPAYWLGALTADGCISGNRIHLDVKAEDVSWLEQFRDAIGFTGKVYIYERHSNSYSNKPKSSLSFTSTYMQSVLRSYGFDNDKTHSAHFCNAVPEEMRRHYIRGLIDGDGSLHYLKQADNWGISLVGTESLVSGVVKHLNKVLGMEINVNPHKMIYSFHVGGVDKTKAIVSYLYSDANYYLPRKKALSERCLKRVSKQRNLSYINLELINNLFVKLNDWNKVAEVLGLNISGLYQIKKRLGIVTSREKLFSVNRVEILSKYKELGKWSLVAEFYGVDRHTLKNKRDKFKL